jgi:23S rRNA (adenine2503-C2)-methyltransferase
MSTQLHFVDLLVGSNSAKLAKHLENLLNIDSKEAKMRANQLINQYFTNLNNDANTFTSLPKEMRAIIGQNLFPNVLDEALTLTGDGGKTFKTLYQLPLQNGQDNSAREDDAALTVQNSIEAVLMQYENRWTLCISCQVGCAMGCPFCATGMLGLTRNLTLAEIVEQIRLALRKMRDEGANLPLNIVFMGMGEPTQNLEAVLGAIELANKYFEIGARNITVSTVGNVPGIADLRKGDLKFKLAISLHAPNNQTRDELIPLNRKYNLDAVLDAAYEYYTTKNVRITIEYALMKDINDSEKDAFTLAKLLNRRGSNWALVNAIPLNKVEGSKWTASSPDKMTHFIDTLRSKGITATLRESRGQDIDGACGQLALKNSQYINLASD